MAPVSDPKNIAAGFDEKVPGSCRTCWTAGVVVTTTIPGLGVTTGPASLRALQTSRASTPQTH